MKDPTSRFSDRVENYIRYRPSYPAAVIDLLMTACNLDDASVVADIGSGTGILTRLLLERELSVVAVEPNQAMKEAADGRLKGYDRLTSIDATAEETSLPAHSVDLIVAGQAFHWFEPDRTREEWARILRPSGSVALIWNEREVDATPFQRAYEAVLRKHATDYASVDHRNIGEAEIRAFFQPGSYELHLFPNEQRFDLDGLIGRCLSSSYMPNEDQPGYGPLVADLEQLFATYQTEGAIRIEYNTSVYLGRFPS